MQEALATFYQNHRVVRPATPPAADDAPVDLVCFDMDGVLIDVGSSWVMVHRHFGVENQAGLRAYLNGEFDDYEFIRRDVRLWLDKKPDLSRHDMEEILGVPPLMEGVVETVAALHKAGVETAIVSGGVNVMAENVAERLGIHHVAANGLLYDEHHRATGEGFLKTPLNDKARPVLEFARELDVELANVLSIGNSMPDVSMFEVTGRSIAFHPEDDYTRQHATWVIEDGPLTRMLPHCLP